jgi:membrane protease YdiL (CAAX protease family)
MIIGAVLLAFAAWALTFGLHWGNFWFKIGGSVLLVCIYSLIWQRPNLRFRPSSLLLGVLSASVLYAIFFLGDFIAPLLLPKAETQVGNIYTLGTGSSRFWIFLLLFFITGPGEEIFWRGFLQDRLMERLGRSGGFALATTIYAGVHIYSLNPMLILAALVAGAFWGVQYLWRRDLLLLIVSHSLWSSVIFTVAPIH